MTWARIDDEFHRHPKARAAGLKGRALYVAALCWTNSQLSDGLILKRDLPIVAADAEVPTSVAKHLVKVGLFDEHPDGYVIHGFLERNMSADQVAERRAKRVEAGRKGGQAKGSKRPPDAQASATADAKHDAKHHAYPMSHDPSVRTSSSSEPVVAPPSAEDETKPIARRVAEVLLNGSASKVQNPKAWLDKAAADVADRTGFALDVAFLASLDVPTDRRLKALAGRHRGEPWPADLRPAERGCDACDKGWIEVDAGVAPCPDCSRSAR